VGFAAAAVFWITAPKRETSVAQTGFRVRSVVPDATHQGLKLAVEGVF
jgi:hypothetical protein